MRKSSLLFAMLLAAAVSTNAYAKGRHHHHHHHHHVPTAEQMKAHAFAGFLSLFASIPVGIAVTSAADHAAAKVLRHQRHHRHKR